MLKLLNFLKSTYKEKKIIQSYNSEDDLEQFVSRRINSKSKVNKSSSQTTYIPKSSTFVKKKYSYKYAKPAPRPMTNKETIEDLSALSVGVIKTISFFLKIFNSITYETLFTIFGKPKVYYWAKNKKHLLAFSTSLINMTMLFLLLKGISIWLIGMG